MDHRRPPPPSYGAPPPPPSTVDNRQPPPHHPPPAYPPYQHPQSTIAPQAPPQYPPATGPALPPIQQHHQSYGQPGPPPEPLPPFRQSVTDPRDGQEHYPYHPQARSGHATPAPVNRTYSHDSVHQRTPTTPAQPGAYPPAPVPEGAPQPPPPHMDHGPHPGYPPTNGVPHGLPPPGPPPGPPPHHEQHQQYMTPMMENHHAPQYAPPQQPPPPMYSQNYGPMAASQYQVQRKKQMRATQACEQCRQRKQKCDEGSPCSFCKENSLTCQYRDTPPAKTDKNMEKVLTYLETLNNKMDSFDDRLRRMEHAPTAPAASAEPPAAPEAVAGAEPQLSPQEEGVKRKPELDDHRTAPHKLLLLWPSVHPLLKDAGANYNDGYVMEAEDRGILRLYTRGEGIDEHDGTQPGGPASPARSEESGNETMPMNAPTPPEGLWGTGFPQTPVSDARRSEPYSWGGLKPDGTLDLEWKTVHDLYQSYISHVHVMHPFLDKARLKVMTEKFCKRYSGDRYGAPHKLAQTFAVARDEPPLKRQRSNGSGAANAVGQGGQHLATETERSPGNAIVYLVLALGKICLHRDSLPSYVPDNRLNANSVVLHQNAGHSGVTSSSPISASIKPSPDFMSPKSTPNTQPTPPAEGGIPFQSRSRRSSMDGMHVAGARNLDVIPGLAYFAKAAEIIGGLGDGNDLVHAQIFLLAGLYKGQLARVKESMSWITMAGRAVLSLLDRYKLYNENYWTAYGDVRKRFEAGQKRIKDTRLNQIVLASWTCLQLESDILAELRLPGSGIVDVENLLLMPHKVPEDESYEAFEAGARQEEDDNIMFFYSSQMFLRKRLNQVHREMYGPDCLSQSLDQVRLMLKDHEDTLGYWRAALPPALYWDDNDAPAADILSARLRAKYWGARYVINRPFLDYALHIMPHVIDGKRVREVAKDVHGNPRDKAEVHLFEAIQGMGQTLIWEAAQRCIEAAMQSTVAFDGVPERLIVTNIHGTAHAQFGNMLVLSAVTYNNWLQTLIDKERFQGLLERTIRFLRRLSPISPTCNIDCRILEQIKKLLFELSPDQKHIYRNEGVEPMSATNSFGAST